MKVFYFANGTAACNGVNVSEKQIDAYINWLANDMARVIIHYQNLQYISGMFHIINNLLPNLGECLVELERIYGIKNGGDRKSDCQSDILIKNVILKIDLSDFGKVKLRRLLGDFLCFVFLF
jgi:hypothetical protein